jgi:uncharacterized membrane protein YkvA (DUF1232 family)
VFRQPHQEQTMKKIVVFCLGLLAVLYILNPTAGLFEIIPDNLPFVGNLDEAAAVALLLMCLKYFGIDLPDIFRRRHRDETTIEIDRD